MEKIMFMVLLVVMMGNTGVVGKYAFDNMVVFGDSLTDTGNVYASRGYPKPPCYYEGRYSDGPVWIEYFAQNLGLPFPEASVLGGFNYAYGGARTGYGISDDICCTIECCTYGGDGGGLYSGNQTLLYLAEHTPNSKTLVVIWIGANDISSEYPTATSASNIIQMMTMLINAGAKYFLVLNMPDLGIAPLYHGTIYQGLATGAAIALNTAIDTALNTLTANFTGVTIYRSDLFALSSNLSFIEARGVEDISGYSISLSNPTNESSPIIVSSNASINAWWDTEHPTTKLHKAIADYVTLYTFNSTTNAALNAIAFSALVAICVLANLLI